MLMQQLRTDYKVTLCYSSLALPFRSDLERVMLNLGYRCIRESWLKRAPSLTTPFRFPLSDCLLV